MTEFLCGLRAAYAFPYVVPRPSLPPGSKEPVKGQLEAVEKETAKARKLAKAQLRKEIDADVAAIRTVCSNAYSPTPGRMRELSECFGTFPLGAMLQRARVILAHELGNEAFVIARALAYPRHLVGRWIRLWDAYTRPLDPSSGRARDIDGV